MNQAAALLGQHDSRGRATLNWGMVLTIFWESVWNALIRAFLVKILGGVAISLLGDVFGEMTPSPPPGLAHRPEAQGAPSPAWRGLEAFIAQHTFWILFVAFYVLIVAAELAPFLTQPRHRRLAARCLLIHRRVSAHWFSLLVGNGLVAWVATAVFIFGQQFSWAQFFGDALHSLVQPLLHMLTSIPGASLFGRWLSWYSQNQAKFFFWLFYSAAICDDLGLPNYKTLLRWGGRRLKRAVRARFGATEVKTNS